MTDPSAPAWPAAARFHAASAVRLLLGAGLLFAALSAVMWLTRPAAPPARAG